MHSSMRLHIVESSKLNINRFVILNLTIEIEDHTFVCVCPLPADDLMPIDSFMPGVHRRPNHFRIAAVSSVQKRGHSQKR